MEKIDAEKVDHVEETGKGPRLKLDRHGIPMEPQPSDHADDPLNWPLWGRVYIALIVSGMGFTTQMGGSLINPAFVIMSKDLHVTVVQVRKHPD